MPRSLLLYGVLAASAAPLPPQNPRYRPNADELEIHRITLQDAVRMYLRPSSSWNAPASLDPYVRPLSASRFAADTGRRLSREAIDQLLRAAALRQVCEPVSDNACRGPIRGTVFRLTEIRYPGRDSAQAVLLATAARSEFDNTVLVPRIRYSVYQLERRAGEWTITRAQRGLPFLPPNVISSSRQ